MLPPPFPEVTVATSDFTTAVPITHQDFIKAGNNHRVSDHLLENKQYHCLACGCDEPGVMSERKVLTKYYPPDFDPSKIARTPKHLRPTGPKTISVRLMAPFSMKCTSCGEYICKLTYPSSTL